MKKDNHVPTLEKRTAPRLPRNESVSIQLMFPSEDNACAAHVADSVTVDVSKHGLRLLLPECIEAGRIFDLCIEIAGEPRRFLLTGETRWCHRLENNPNAYEIGIEILHGEGTDYTAWEHFFAVGQ
jgi:hypothetical protein